MKKSVLVLLTAIISFTVNAQILNPVQWEFSVEKLGDRSYEVHMTAMIENGWHIYAQDAGKGPVPTSFTYNANPLLEAIGKIKELGKLEKVYDPNFKSELKYYSTQVDFVQKVKTKSAAITFLKGVVSFMVCNDRQCLPPRDVVFNIKVGGK